MLKLFLRSIAMVVLLVSMATALPLPAHATPTNPMHLAALPIVSNLMKGQRPNTLGVKEGKLASCPKSPNCVVSQGQEDAEHAIAPLQYEGDRTTAMARLVDIIGGMPRTKIIQQTEDYLYAEFTSQWMGFVDDVEFYLPDNPGIIHVRSASRLGESDLGVNRQRIESVRSQFNDITNA
jgi:uncharacterized protein (DUF1499 family)